MTETNIEVARSLAARGFYVFPCHAKGDEIKRPHGVRWSQQSTTDLSQIERWWTMWPDDAVGLDCGKSGLIVIDADRHGADDGVEAFGKLMVENGFDPDSTMLVSTPNQGNHHFFIQPPGSRLGNGRGSLPPGIDVRGAGGYVIAPGTIMGDGRTYEQFGDAIVDLPDWLAKILTQRNEPSAPTPAQRDFPNKAGYAEIEEMLATIDPDCAYDVWVTVLMAVHAETNGGGFSLADAWSARGSKYPGAREMSKKWASFKRSGITGRSLADIASQYGADLRAIAIKYNPIEPEHEAIEAAEAAALLRRGKKSTALAVTPAADYTPLPMPQGLVGEIAQWIIDTSQRKQPDLAIAAALALVGTSAGRQFVGPTQAGTVMYILGLAPTGQGKDAAVVQSRRALEAARLSDLVGPDEFMSFSALVNLITRKPVCLALMDEFGDFMRRCFDKHGGQHTRSIPKVLRTAWGRNFAAMNTAEWADKQSASIVAPALSILGMSTPQQFYSALEVSAKEDGTLNRFLIVEGVAHSKRCTPALDPMIVPQHVEDGLVDIWKTSGDLPAATRMISQDRPALVQVNWAPDGAEGIYEAFADRMEKEMLSHPDKADIWARAAEMAVRLGTIVAIGRRAVVVERSDIEYGVMLAEKSANTMLRGAAMWMAENEQSANVQRIQRHLVKIRRWIDKKELAYEMRHIKKRDLQEMLDMMEDAEMVEVKRDPPSRIQRTYYRAKQNSG